MYANKASYANETGRDGERSGRGNGLEEGEADEDSKGQRRTEKGLKGK